MNMHSTIMDDGEERKDPRWAQWQEIARQSKNIASGMRSHYHVQVNEVMLDQAKKLNIPRSDMEAAIDHLMMQAVGKMSEDQVKDALEPHLNYNLTLTDNAYRHMRFVYAVNQYLAAYSGKRLKMDELGIETPTIEYAEALVRTELAHCGYGKKAIHEMEKRLAKGCELACDKVLGSSPQMG
jgi:hypothetical protein